MNIIRMTGGLGNQMFAYALYLKLVSLGKEVKFDDKTEYENDNARPLMLWAFGLDYPRASKEEICEITDGFLSFKDRVRRKLFGRKSLEYREADCNFDLEVLNREPAYLTGYFQSERYFRDVEEEVRRAFTFGPQIYDGLSKTEKDKVLSYLAEIENSISVSIHIRRGDYVTSSEIYGGNCTEEYYEAAVSLIREREPAAKFFVFSNDEKWTEEWLERSFSGDENFILAENISEEKGYLAMHLMSRCKHHILANSSFSWWGAYLNPAKNKTVIAPARWFNNQDCRDIYTKDMIRISAEGKRKDWENNG